MTQNADYERMRGDLEDLRVQPATGYYLYRIQEMIGQILDGTYERGVGPPAHIDSSGADS